MKPELLRAYTQVGGTGPVYPQQVIRAGPIMSALKRMLPDAVRSCALQGTKKPLSGGIQSDLSNPKISECTQRSNVLKF